jgi:predicted nucleic acid-binding protein
VELLASRGKRGLSLVDCTSFVLMRRLGVETALAFDEDFRGEGFRVYGDETLPR